MVYVLDSLSLSPVVYTYTYTYGQSAYAYAYLTYTPQAPRMACLPTKVYVYWTAAGADYVAWRHACSGHVQAIGTMSTYVTRSLLT